jgi:hypothetical protein
MMIRKISAAIAAASFMLATLPAAAQSEPEQPRTTYRIIYLKLKPGADDRWTELSEKYYGPAQDEAKVKRPTIHWLVTGPWDLMLIQEMPRGLATMDKHETPERTAMRKAMAKVAGGEEAAKKIFDESDALVAESSITLSHTHP